VTDFEVCGGSLSEVVALLEIVRSCTSGTLVVGFAYGKDVQRWETELVRLRCTTRRCVGALNCGLARSEVGADPGPGPLGLGCRERGKVS
jgi:hypothetical protein